MSWSSDFKIWFNPELWYVFYPSCNQHGGHPGNCSRISWTLATLNVAHYFVCTLKIPLKSSFGFQDMHWQWVALSVEFSHDWRNHVIHMVRTVQISKVVPSRVVTMSPMSLMILWAETKKKHHFTPKLAKFQKQHGFSIALTHLHPNQYLNRFSEICRVYDPILFNKCHCQFACCGHKVVPL